MATTPAMTYQQWIEAGRPALKLSTLQMAPWLSNPVSIQRLNTLCKEGVLVRVDRKIDTSHPSNADWLRNHESTPPRHKPVGRWGPKNTEPEPDTGGIPQIWPAPPPKKKDLPDGVDLDAIDLDAILETAEGLHFNTLTPAATQKLQRLEAAAKARVDRLAKRGQLIDRTLVATVFGRLHQIDSNELRTLGSRLAPTVAGALGVETAEGMLEVERLIEAEVTKSLAHQKRLLSDFLADIGAEATL